MNAPDTSSLRELTVIRREVSPGPVIADQRAESDAKRLTNSGESDVNQLMASQVGDPTCILKRTKNTLSYSSRQLWRQSQIEKQKDHRAPAGDFVKDVHAAVMNPRGSANRAIHSTTTYIPFAGCAGTAH